MKFRLATAILALTASVALAESHGGENPMVGGAAMFADKNIVENAVNSADHTTLVAAVQAAGLVETLQSAGPFTVFAPVNDAFAESNLDSGVASSESTSVKDSGLGGPALTPVFRLRIPAAPGQPR